jgi:hypothetical protein
MAPTAQGDRNWLTYNSIQERAGGRSSALSLKNRIAVWRTIPHLFALVGLFCQASARVDTVASLRTDAHVMPTSIDSLIRIPVIGLVEVLIVLLGTATAFWIGYAYVIWHPLQWSWHQHYFGPAINYACTGHLGPLLLAPDATASTAGLEAVGHLYDFLSANRLDLPCDLLPRLQKTSLLNGLDVANQEQPFHLILLYAAVWRWFGPSWTTTYFVIATVVAASFLVIYLCLRRFTSALAAAAVTLISLSSPFFLTNVSSPRDAVKFPFAIAIAALLIGTGSRPRPPLRYCLFAALIGLLIGIGYGFRSDLMFFLLPASFIVFFLGRAISGRPTSTLTTLDLHLVGVRLLALGALLVSFFVGGFMPLINDHVLRANNYADMGYQALAMGLLGQTRRDLYQSHGLDGMYMYRNDYANDLAVGFRIMEQSARRYGEDVDYARGPYWTYGKRYYLDLVRTIPADLVSGGIGAFVNLMTMPRSFFDRHSMAFFDPQAPWTKAYSCAPGSAVCHEFTLAMDRIFLATSRLSPAPLFAANSIALFIFMCLIAKRYGFQSAVAAFVLLGAILMVTSLKFEMRHIFYIYVFPVVAWTAVAAWAIRALIRLAIRKGPKDPSKDRHLDLAPLAVKIGVLTAALAAAILAALWSARLYQVAVLRGFIEDLASRASVSAEYRIAERGPGLSIIRILSPMPLSTGGVRAADAPAKPRVEMGVVAIEFDGNECPDRLIRVSSASDSAAWSKDTTFLIHETFALTLRGRDDYVAFLPAFNYLLNGIDTTFVGIEIENANVSCIKAVKLVSEFKKEDVLFDFFTPKDPKKISTDDLYQKVYLPGLGFI